MPLKLRVILAGTPPQNPFQHAKGLRALALRWIAAVDPAMAEEMHEANQPKPYSISPLWRDNSPEGECRFEIGLLVDDLAAPILQGMGRCERSIHLGDQPFTIRDVRVFAETGWTDLLSPPKRTVHELAFRLSTPTAHHAAGPLRKSIVTPSPETYFAGWLARWNLYAPAPFDPVLLSWVEQQVAVKEFNGGTRMVWLDAGRSFIGFQGAVTFAVLKPETLPAEAGVMLTALSRFAVYSSTGVDTMRGMGQTQLAPLS
jgi:CRISPR-associated endoribonuclease Cas6